MKQEAPGVDSFAKKKNAADASRRHHVVRQAPDFHAMIVGRQAAPSARPPSAVGRVLPSQVILKAGTGAEASEDVRCGRLRQEALANFREGMQRAAVARGQLATTPQNATEMEAHARAQPGGGAAAAAAREAGDGAAAARGFVQHSYARGGGVGSGEDTDGDFGGLGGLLTASKAPQTPYLPFQSPRHFEHRMTQPVLAPGTRNRHSHPALAPGISEEDAVPNLWSRRHSTGVASTSSSRTYQSSSEVRGDEAVAAGTAGIGTAAAASGGWNINVPRPGRDSQAKSRMKLAPSARVEQQQQQLQQQQQQQQQQPKPRPADQLPAAFRRLLSPPKPAYMRDAGDDAVAPALLSRPASTAGGERPSRSGPAAPAPARLLVEAWERFELGDAAFGVWEIEGDGDQDQNRDRDCDQDCDQDQGRGKDESEDESESESKSGGDGAVTSVRAPPPVPEQRRATNGDDSVMGLNESSKGTRLNAPHSTPLAL